MGIEVKKVKGFTLIEVMITVAIVGILATIAYPSYTEFIARSNRSEAQREILRVANLMELYFLDHRTYTSDLTQIGLNTSPYTTESNNYIIKTTGTVSSSVFTLVANAQGAQLTNDSACKELFVDQTGKKSATSTDCWER